jgi:hypothetical protein
VARAFFGWAIGALSGWVVMGVPAMGPFSEGGGVRANCLFGVKVGSGALLLLLAGIFALLLLVWVMGAMSVLLGWVCENFSPSL